MVRRRFCFGMMVAAGVLTLSVGLLIVTASAASDPTPPKLIASCMVQPTYPEAERAAGVQGTVTLNVEVRADGSVGEISPKEEVAGHPAFTKSAMEAIRKWCFEPAQVGDRAVKIKIVVPVRFALEEKLEEKK